MECYTKTECSSVIMHSGADTFTSHPEMLGPNVDVGVNVSVSS